MSGGIARFLLCRVCRSLATALGAVAVLRRPRKIVVRAVRFASTQGQGIYLRTDDSVFKLLVIILISLSFALPDSLHQSVTPRHP